MGIKIVKQILAIGLALLVSFAAPAFAQTSNGGSTTQTNRGPTSDDGLTAQNQAPPPPADTSGLLLGGSLALGGALLIGILTSNKDNGPISP
jgi:hypothetical protein